MTPDRNAYPRSGHVFVALVLSMALWAVMVFWSLAYLRRIAGGLEPFDLRPFGYDIGDARALLGALSQLGRDYYLNTQLSLDNAFPATYARMWRRGSRTRAPQPRRSARRRLRWASTSVP